MAELLGFIDLPVEIQHQILTMVPFPAPKTSRLVSSSWNRVFVNHWNSTQPLHGNQINLKSTSDFGSFCNTFVLTSLPLVTFTNCKMTLSAPISDIRNFSKKFGPYVKHLEVNGSSEGSSSTKMYTLLQTANRLENLVFSPTNRGSLVDSVVNGVSSLLTPLTQLNNLFEIFITEPITSPVVRSLCYRATHLRKATFSVKSISSDLSNVVKCLPKNVNLVLHFVVKVPKHFRYVIQLAKTLRIRSDLVTTVVMMEFKHEVGYATTATVETMGTSIEMLLSTVETTLITLHLQIGVWLESLSFRIPDMPNLEEFKLQTAGREQPRLCYRLRPNQFPKLKTLFAAFEKAKSFYNLAIYPNLSSLTIQLFDDIDSYRLQFHFPCLVKLQLEKVIYSTTTILLRPLVFFLQDESTVSSLTIGYSATNYGDAWSGILSSEPMPTEDVLWRIPRVSRCSDHGNDLTRCNKPRSKVLMLTNCSMSLIKVIYWMIRQGRLCQLTELNLRTNIDVSHLYIPGDFDQKLIQCGIANVSISFGDI